MASDHRTEEKRIKDERNGAERCWIYRDGYHYAQVTFTKPDPRLYPTAVEYMRVLSRHEVERQAADEGVELQQLMNSLHRTVDGQRRHITSLQEDNAALSNAVEDLKRERDRYQQHYEIAKAGMLAAREGQ